MSVESLLREVDVLRLAVSSLQARLPPDWGAVATYNGTVAPGLRADAVLTLAAPGGEQVSVVVECKRTLVTRDLPAVAQQLRALSASLPGPAVPLVAARYLSESARSWLEDNGISYADATGNLRLVATTPAVYLRDRGADKDPWRGPGRPRGTLKGDPAARVVRALADFYSPMPITALVKAAGSSTGAAYRVVDFLEEEALLTRGPRGLVQDVQWRRLLERWSRDYGFSQGADAPRYLQPRGLTALLKDLPALGNQMDYAVTGSLAAQQWAPYAPARLGMVYVDDVATAAQALGLRSVDKGANVLLAPPTSSVAFDRSLEIGGVRYAAPSQVVADLLTGPGRNPAEGQELLEWMESNESSWRRQPPGRGA